MGFSTGSSGRTNFVYQSYKQSGRGKTVNVLTLPDCFILSLLLYNVDFCRCMLEKSEINGKMLFDYEILKRQLLLHVKSLCKRRIEYHE